MLTGKGHTKRPHLLREVSHGRPADKEAGSRKALQEFLASDFRGAWVQITRDSIRFTGGGRKHAHESISCLEQGERGVWAAL